MLRFKNFTDKDATKIDGTSFSDLVTLLYCCVSSACKREGVDFTYDLDTFADYLDLEEVTAWATDLNEGSKKKDAGDDEITIYDLLGEAVGNIGLTLDDFCRLYLSELEAIFDAYNKRKESEYHDEWERMRLQATILVQPHIKKKMTPRALLPLPWDKSDKPNAAKAEVLSKEEALKRFKQRINAE